MLNELRANDLSKPVTRDFLNEELAQRAARMEQMEIGMLETMDRNLPFRSWC